MSIWDGISLSQLIDVYSVSNTASFLYSRFRKNITVIDLAERYTPEELLEALKTALADKATIENIVRAYVCLVALSFSNPDVLRNAIDFLDMEKLRWSYHILGISEQSYVPTEYINASQKINSASVDNVISNSSAATDIQTIACSTDE